MCIVKPYELLDVGQPLVPHKGAIGHVVVRETGRQFVDGRRDYPRRRLTGSLALRLFLLAAIRIQKIAGGPEDIPGSAENTAGGIN